MKKVTYLIVLMFSMVLMSTSCSKPENDTPLPTDLLGTWKFQSLFYNSNTTTTCDVVGIIGYAKLDLENVDGSNMTLYGECNNDRRTYSYNFDGVTINCANGSRVFEFVSLNGNELKLILKNASTNGLPIGGTYTFKRVQ